MAHSSMQIFSRAVMFWGCRRATRTFNSRHRFSMGLRSGDWLGHSRTFKCFLRSHSFVARAVGADLWIEELENTKYNGDDDEVNAWGKFYLPEIVKMQVIGVVKGTSCPCDELVLMTREDKKLYGYDGEELHLVASSFLELCDKTIEYPASKRYYNGEAFKDMVRRRSENSYRSGQSVAPDYIVVFHRKLINMFVSLLDLFNYAGPLDAFGLDILR
uniref:Uncharacterized protein n=1 Tax=Maylandia zebra TaxID=106582 RepID=A0A3P9DL66_9CICH